MGQWAAQLLLPVGVEDSLNYHVLHVRCMPWRLSLRDGRKVCMLRNNVILSRAVYSSLRLVDYIIESTLHLSIEGCIGCIEGCRLVLDSAYTIDHRGTVDL